MGKKFFIIMGKPGSGKGTQAELLKQELEKEGGEVLHVTTGGTLREFIKEDNFVARRAREVQNSGLLQPEFLSVWNWTNIFIKNLTSDTSVILDGAPRKTAEVEALHELFPFLGYDYPPIIYVNVSDAWAMDRQKFRSTHSDEKREDQNEAEIETRMNEFEKHILPCMAMYRDDPRYRFIHVNGEQTVEEVHAEIMKKLDEVRR